MDIKNYVGQTSFDVADPDVLRLLEELKKKQATLQKDRPDIRYLFNRPPVPPGSQNTAGGKRRYVLKLLVMFKIKVFGLKKQLFVKNSMKCFHELFFSNVSSPYVSYKSPY